jgi:NitT/TauT family transport system permease protein
VAADAAAGDTAVARGGSGVLPPHDRSTLQRAGGGARAAAAARWPGARSRRSRPRIPPAIQSILLCVALIALLQLASGPVLDPLWFPKPLDVASALADMLRSGDIWQDVRVTIIEVGIGFTLGVIIGSLLAAAFSLSDTATRVLMPYLLALYTLPKVALIPWLVLTIGIGMQLKIVMVVLNVVFLIFLNVLAGLTLSSKRLAMSLEVMGATRVERFMKVGVPSALPWLLTGMRISARYALGGAIVAELLSSNVGLGYRAARATSELHIPELFAVATLLTLISIALILVLQAVERRFVGWKLG